MNTIHHLLRRPTTAAARLVLMLSVGLGVIVLTPTAGHADETSNPGYVDLRDTATYISANPTWQVLHIDTDHATADGFWYAIAEDNSYLESTQTPTPVRNMRWEYQRWGAWCDGSYKVVGFNTTLGGYRCGPDVAALTRDFPDYPNQVSLCQASSGNPYEDARPIRESNGTVSWLCDNWVNDDQRLVDSNGVYMRAPQMSSCAPWERQGRDANGYPDCLHEFYSWLNDPRFPNGGYANTGATVTRTAEADARVTESATVTRSRTATARVAHGQKTVKLTGTVRGRRVTVTGTAPVLVSATATVSRTSTMSATIDRTRTASCAAATAADAQACAERKALAAAKAAASATALELATSEATRIATSEAKSAAAARARNVARTTAPTRQDVADALQTARQRARAKLASLQG